jgi:hypothetical protein
LAESTQFRAWHNRCCFGARVTASTPPVSVAIISRNSATALSLQAYFRLHEVDSVIHDRIDGPRDGARVAAILVFPDEFSDPSMMDDLRGLIQRVPASSIVVVTSETARFEDLMSGVGVDCQDRVLVMPRPVWGWALLEQVLGSVP